jgi:hypothetical protein
MSIVIEYRHLENGSKRGRRSIPGMISYLKGLVDEMRSVDIDAKYLDTVVFNDYVSTVLVNGKDIFSILDGLEIKMLDDDDCDPKMKKKIITFGRPATDWYRDEVEDIPDVLMKNAASKAYADANRDGTL